MQEEINRLFSSYGGVSPGFPALNLWASEEGALAAAELPGVDPNSLDISVVAGTLTLRGERRPADVPEGAVFHRQEREFGAFSRTLDLPFQVDSNQVQAEYRNGMLSLRMPRSEEDKPKRIAVKPA
jgi:HSP20 family protein